MATEKKVFVRKATGLVREIGPLTAILIVLCNTIGLGWQKRIFQFTGQAPIPENTYLMGAPPMLIAFLIAGIIVLFSVLSFAILTSAMPRSGGGYVVISRVVGPFWGFVGSWAEFLSIAWSFGIIAVAVFEAVGIFGAVVGISLPWTAVQMFAGGLVLVIIFTAIGALGVRMTGYLLQTIFWIPAILTIYLYALLVVGAGNPSLVATGLQTVTGKAASDYVSAALSQGMATAFPGDYFGALMVAMLGAYWAYIGYAASTFVAGEVKEAAKTLPRTLTYASVLIIAIYLTVSGFTYAASKVAVTPDGKWSLFSALAYLSYGSGSLAKAGLPGIKGWSSIIGAFAGSGMGLGGLNILILVFAVFWVMNDIPPFILTASRIIFAMSFDRMLPESLSSVNERFHAPVNATIFTGIVALLGVASESGVFGLGASWNPGSNAMLNNMFSTGVASTNLYDGIFFTLFALALVLFPYRKKEIFDKAPWKPGGAAVAVIVGLVAFLGNLFLDWVFLYAPAGSYNLGALPTASDPLTAGFALWFSIALLVLGALIYGYYRYRAKTTGVDYTTIFTQIPPE